MADGAIDLAVLDLEDALVVLDGAGALNLDAGRFGRFLFRRKDQLTLDFDPAVDAVVVSFGEAFAQRHGGGTLGAAGQSTEGPGEEQEDAGPTYLEVHDGPLSFRRGSIAIDCKPIEPPN